MSLMDPVETALWRAIAQGEAEPSWELFTRELPRSNRLTEAGRETARWAMTRIAAFLGEPWLRRSFRDGSPMMLWLWTPLNDAPHTHLRRIELAARLALLQDSPGWRDLRKLARERTAAWGPLLLQLEVGGLALRYGRRIEFEPRLVTGKRGDLLLRGATAMLIETTSVGMSEDMRRIGRFTDRAFWGLQMIELRRDVAIRGSVAAVVGSSELDRWLAEVDAAAARISGTGRRSKIFSPGGGEIELIAGALDGGEMTALSGPPITGDEWVRLASRIEDKAEQGAGDAPLWIRIDEGLSLWGLTEQASRPRPDMHAALAANIRDAIAPFPHVVGAVVSGPPGFGVPGGTVGVWDVLDGAAVGLVVALGQNLHREVVIVAAEHGPGAEQLAEWLTWYQNEATWLDWALQSLGHPPTMDLLRDGR